MRRGSALLMALWTILVLGVIAISFAFEAKMQGSVNIYVQDKNRGKRLIEAGRILGETIILNYGEAREPELRGGEADWSEIFEKEDRWCREKYELKTASKCTVGPIVLDDKSGDAGAVKVEISMSSGDGGGVNVNNLYGDGDKNYILRWQMILDMCGVPRENDFRTKDGKSINLQHRIIACWNDYRDGDDNTVTSIENVNCGAEKKEYEEYYDDNKDDFAEEDRFAPANGPISDLKELSRVLCFQEYPAVLTGGVLNPWEDKKSQISISRGLMNMGMLSSSCSDKINVNDCSVDALLSVPGIYDEDEIDEDDKTESRETAEAIVKCRSIKPQDYDVDESRSWWPYKSWDDLRSRVADEFDIYLNEETKEYVTFTPDENTIFKMKIIVSQLDDEYTAECECYVKDKKVRYVSWKE